MGWFWGEPQKRKTKKQKLHEKGRRSYKKGKDFEKKAYSFLSRKGFIVHKTRLRFKGGEFDGSAVKQGRNYGVEIKATKAKVTSTVITKLKKKIDRFKASRIIKGGVIVSRNGYTDEAWHLARKHGIIAYRYKPKKKQ